MSLYFLDYFKLIKAKNILLYFRNGIKIKIRPQTNDRIILNEIFIYHLYTPKYFEIKNNDLVVDVGAHIGIFSIFASQFARKVYAIEPVLENFKILESNIQINKIKNITPVNKAISGTTGERDMFLDETNPGGHSFYPSSVRPKKRKVLAISLKDFFIQNNISGIDFLKMDCEGAEYEIFFNCPDEILFKIKKISLEYHDIDKTRNLFSLREFLERKGFKVKILSKNKYQIYAKNQLFQ